MKKITYISIIILFLGISGTLHARTCLDLGYTTPTKPYKAPTRPKRTTQCLIGQLVEDGYNPGEKLKCEDTQLDHLISLFEGYCAGLSEEDLKKLSNHPKNLVLTHRTTNRLKSNKGILEFIDDIESKNLAAKIFTQGMEVKQEVGMMPTSKEFNKLITFSLKRAKILDNTIPKKMPSTIKFNGTVMKTRAAIKLMSNSIALRASVRAGRAIGSLPAQAIPMGVGTSVVIGVTAWDLKDACDTTRELYELNKAIDPDSTEDFEVDKVCGYTLPTSEEVLEIAKESPQMAWDTAKEYVPNAETFSNIDFDNIDWGNIWSNSYDATKSFANEVVEGSGTLSKKVIEGTGTLTNKVLGIFGSD